MVIILDNVINNVDSVKVEIQDILKDENIDEQWCTFDKNHKFQDFCCKFIDIASNFYDMSSCVGYEFWTQNNSRPSEWHYDKDEDFLKEKGVLHFPLCSMVYYPVVEDLQGGQLHLECDIITPKENRLVIFPPKTFHYVEPFTGKRVSLLINPWSKVLNKFTD